MQLKTYVITKWKKFTTFKQFTKESKNRNASYFLFDLKWSGRNYIYQNGFISDSQTINHFYKVCFKTIIQFR